MRIAIPDRWLSFCHEVGAGVPHWTQGAGGNLSLKEGNLLWIKATGWRLDSVSSQHGVAQVDRNLILPFLNPSSFSSNEVEASEIAYSEILEKSSSSVLGLGRPSMETGFHAKLPLRWVAHFHSLAAILLYHEWEKDPRSVEAWLIQKTALASEWIAFCNPGLELAHRMSTHSNLYFLGQHGIVLHSNETQIFDEWKQIEIDFCREYGYAKLLACLQAEKRFESLFEEFCLKPNRLFYYFPDIAVFAGPLKNLLQVSNQDRFVFPLDKTHDHRNLAELWLAAQILNAECPNLPELPEETCRKLVRLPTEKKRIAAHGQTPFNEKHRKVQTTTPVGLKNDE